MTASEYATVAGVPVAVAGFLLSLVLVPCSAAWWRRGDRRPLLAVYWLLLPATLVVAWLTYVELFVLHAVCAWCVTYALSVVGALAVAGLALRRG